jgi:hypothetical protein
VAESFIFVKKHRRHILWAKGSNCFKIQLVWGDFRIIISASISISGIVAYLDGCVSLEPASNAALNIE